MQQVAKPFLDRAIRWLLFLPPPAQPVTSDEQTTRSAENTFGLALAVSGFRCIAKYVVLPFILPIVGIAGSFSAVISLVINAIAIGGIIYSLRQFWLIDYKYKWQYLPVALVGFGILSAFIYFDLMELL